MISISCITCGSKELSEEGGFSLCIYCGSRFVRTQDERPGSGTAIEVDSDVQRLLQKCKDDPSNCRRYAELILDIDPTNSEVRRYLT